MFDLGRSLMAAAARSPDAVALIDGGDQLTYNELLDRAAQSADRMSRLGIRKGDRLVTLLTNRIEMAVLHWACQLAAITITPLNWRVKAADLDYFLKDSGASALVFEASTADTVAGSVSAQVLPQIGVDAMGDKIFGSFGEGASLAG